MTDKRKELSDALYGSASSIEEQILTQITIERICVDMADFFTKFYKEWGPGAIVYIPDAADEKNSMFYLTVDQLIAAQDDFRKEGMEGPEEVMRKTIVQAERVNVEKEALFLIQDNNKMALLHYNREKPIPGPIKA